MLCDLTANPTVRLPVVLREEQGECAQRLVDKSVGKWGTYEAGLGC